MMAVWAAVHCASSSTESVQEVQRNLLELRKILYFHWTMAENSVDDMYRGCEDKMSEMAKKYLTKEKNENQNFTDAWDQ
ncbi:hypothetical protein L3Q82_023413, partial [Scortum barcoo]